MISQFYGRAGLGKNKVEWSGKVEIWKVELPVLGNTQISKWKYILCKICFNSRSYDNVELPNVGARSISHYLQTEKEGNKKQWT